jgi:hypothetical protein
VLIDLGQHSVGRRCASGDRRLSFVGRGGPWGVAGLGAWPASGVARSRPVAHRGRRCLGERCARRCLGRRCRAGQAAGVVSPFGHCGALRARNAPTNQDKMTKKRGILRPK